MTIYEIRQCGGEYEDRFDDHVSAYVSRAAAEAELTRLEKEELAAREQRVYCNKCPLAYKNWKTMEEFEVDKKEHEYYAPCVKDAIAKCEAYVWGISVYNNCWKGFEERRHYYIEEMEVVEE